MVIVMEMGLPGEIRCFVSSFKSLGPVLSAFSIPPNNNVRNAIVADRSVNKCNRFLSCRTIVEYIENCARQLNVIVLLRNDSYSISISNKLVQNSQRSNPSPVKYHFSIYLLYARVAATFNRNLIETADDYLNRSYSHFP